MKTDDETLISALRILAAGIKTDDGVVNACIAEAANRLEELTAGQSPFSKPFTNPASGMGIRKDGLRPFQESINRYIEENLKQ